MTIDSHSKDLESRFEQFKKRYHDMAAEDVSEVLQQ